MKFSEMVDQVGEFLRRRERVSYRALKREFDLDDESLEDLKAELIDAQRIATDEDGKVLVWVGSLASRVQSLESKTTESSDPRRQTLDLRPISYTPRHLAERIRAEQAAMEARGDMDGERKTITALFADLKGSTALIEGLDPEEARAIIDPALQLMMDAVHRYEGYVAQALGDGIFALFGAPIAHEDHPQRALYAALRMQEEMRRHSDQSRLKGGVPLQMRVGINTGEVVVRSIHKDDLHTDYVPVGHSTNLAARMEQMATPGSILVTAHTHKLTDGYFAFKALGIAEIKGVEEPLNVYEVLGAGPLRTRFQVTARRGLTRFVGRRNELEALQQALVQAKAGHGQVVGVMGEPGLGKSRLFYEFKLTSQSGGLVLEAYSVSHGKASPYLPVIELLKSYFQIQVSDDERTRREKVGGKVLMLDRSLEDTLPYLFALLGIEDPSATLQQMDPQIRRRRTFEAVKRLVLRESLNQPLILIFEDLHWIDGETQELLDVLSESLASARILLLTNYRPEYRSEWGQKTYYTQLRLSPLGREEAEEFLDALLGESGFPLPRGERARERVTENTLHSLKQLILEKTQGTPFFMEEIVQELFEQGILVRDAVGARRAVPLLTDLHIPTTVQGVLAARIDRLVPDEKALLQQLSVIGREFPLSLIRQVIPQPEEDLYRLLSSLQHKEFLYEQPAFPEVEYLFKHALTQEVAYGTVLQERRKALHDQTGQAIERLYTANLDEHYSELAHHYQRSGNTEKAIEYLQKAGQQAVHRSAHVEAISHLTIALSLLETLPATPERPQQELTLQTTIGPALIAIKGYGSPEVARSYHRARELCRQIGETPQLYSTLLGVWVSHLIQADLQTARELGEQLLRLAQATQDSSLFVGAHWAFGETLLFLGDLEPAQVQLEQGSTLYDFQAHNTQAFQYGQDHGMTCLSFGSFVLWLLGYPDQALQRSREATALAQNLFHLNSQAFALTISLWVFEFRREAHIVRERAEALIALATERGGALWDAWGTIFLGWALAKQGRREEGIAHLQRGLVAFRETGAEMTRPHFLTLLAEMQGQVGQVEEGLAILTEALDITAMTSERWFEAETYRLRGELTLQRECKVPGSKFQVADPRSLTPDPQSEAEACFLKAIEIAQRQRAKSLELRAAMSLARLWRQQGKAAEAHQMLVKVYNWFTEGFDTADLQDAKSLIEELS